MFIFNNSEAKQAGEELTLWTRIDEAIGLEHEKKLKEAEQLYSELSKTVGGKDRALANRLLLQSKDVHLSERDAAALQSVTAKNWREAIETYSEMKSDIEQPNVPERWKKEEANIEERRTLLQKIQKGEGYESNKNKDEAYTEYDAALKLQARQKLPGVSEWLNEHLEKTNYDRKTYLAKLEEAQKLLRARDWVAAKAPLEAALKIRSTPEIELLKSLRDDGEACEVKHMSLVVKAFKVVDGGGYNRASAFCIDKYEWPSTAVSLVKPTASKSWADAKKICESQGKRLCSSREWEDACRGGRNMDQAWPYGNAADQDKCNTNSNDAQTSGAKKDCVNAIGVYDMSGNLAEWTDDGNVRGGSYQSPAGNSSCGDSVDQGKNGSPQVGFRCCDKP
jgi:hypothetical protein